MKNKAFKGVILWTFALAFNQLAVQAQQYSIDWFKIAAGAGTSTNGQYVLSGSIGQQDASAGTSGGSYTMSSGFWSLVAVLQTAGEGPRLTISNSGRSITISWPSPSTGYGLQQNTSPEDPSGWIPFSGPVSDNGATKSITISLPAGTMFFRLRQ